MTSQLSRGLRRAGVGRLAVAGASAAILAGYAVAGAQTAHAAEQIRTWAAWQQPDHWLDQSDGIHFTVATTSLGQNDVGHTATFTLTPDAATLIDCDSLGVGYGSASGWKNVTASAQSCSDSALTFAFPVAQDMVGSTVTLSGWEGVSSQAASYSTQATVAVGSSTGSSTFSASPSGAVTTRSAGAGSTPTAQPTSAPTTTSAPTSTATSTATSSAPSTSSAQSATVDEEFSSWNGNSKWSPSGAMRINGDWWGTGGNWIARDNASVSGGYLNLVSSANTKVGSEIQTDPATTFGTGYYETRMKSASVSGVVSSFFLMSSGYQAPEIDVEILSKDAGAGKQHLVYYTVHETNGASHEYAVIVPFDPSAGFHTYGILVQNQKVSFYIDGAFSHSYDGLTWNMGVGTLQLQMLANSWAGNSSWIGSLPTQDTLTQYDWMRAYNGASAPVFG